ncbi:hypothetical protein NA56DRAFT_698652 [Hyaloscypha hepaticicola]|uniref:Uncharacterized protein n=1 Tax=Hyaloscypha hepaticicola TaxID=2082293 RepID=A0A2J6QJN2_9HELO|nr:hypothetical protein NA56DRAFT_698652 [Hyaloscypha hepaticicola]
MLSSYGTWDLFLGRRTGILPLSRSLSILRALSAAQLLSPSRGDPWVGFLKQNRNCLFCPLAPDLPSHSTLSSPGSDEHPIPARYFSAVAGSFLFNGTPDLLPTDQSEDLKWGIRFLLRRTREIETTLLLASFPVELLLDTPTFLTRHGYSTAQHAYAIWRFLGSLCRFSDKFGSSAIKLAAIDWPHYTDQGFAMCLLTEDMNSFSNKYPTVLLNIELLVARRLLWLK